MSFAKTWTFSLNQTPETNTSQLTTNASFFLQLAAFLVANGWSYDGSCDGTDTHATNNVTTNANWVWAAEASAHSWMILKSPVGIVAGAGGSYTGDQSRVWMVLSSNSTGATGLINMFLVKPTGGTTTATPTDATTSLGFATAAICRATYASALFHFGVTTQGNFWAGITHSGSGRMPFFMALFPTSNPSPYKGLDYPYATALFKYALDSASTPVLTALVTANFKCWDEFGLTAVPVVAALGYGSGANASAALGYGNASGVNRSGVVESVAGYLHSSAAGGLIAKIVDFEFTGATAVPMGSTDNATVTRVSAYQLFIPANAALTF